MRVWVDICHTPQYNFYKNFIERLVQDGHQVYVTILKRGKTPLIVKKEIGNVTNIFIYEIGRHRMNKISALIEANVFRLISLFFWRLTHNVDITFGNGMQPAIIQAIFCGDSYSFDDDPQTADFKPKARYNTECNFCLYEDEKVSTYGGNVKVLKCLKEWAYLNLRSFNPNVNVLEKYDLKPKEYIFLREVSVGTVNYAGQESGAVLNIKHLIPKDKKVLFSLEEKHRRDEYPSDWILLQEPIEDIHSLIYYSCGLVSSGDSMAREAALLGVPAYYLGIRHSMPANLAASKVANLQNEKTMPFSEWVKTLNVSAEEAEQMQMELRKKIDSEFIDINEYMMQLVETHKHG